MRTSATIAAALMACAIASPLAGQSAPPPVSPTPPPTITRPLSPSEIVTNARAEEWRDIAAEDLLIMALAPVAAGRERRIIIQLMPAPFSEGWVSNVRVLARAHWWDGLAIVRVQDNYVTQWGDPNGEDAALARALPSGLRVMTDNDYLTRVVRQNPNSPNSYDSVSPPDPPFREILPNNPFGQVAFADGWPVGQHIDSAGIESLYPIHCYGMVGVGRNLSPDTGSGAELYTVIGHAPRHLDTNVALIGRVVEGMQHLSSLPRGTGQLGFYETPAERTAIASIRLASELPAAEQPRFQYLSTDSQSFDLYAGARANRRDPFFNRPGGGTDVCNIPVPVRRVPQS